MNGKSIFASLIDARQQQANRFVKGYLATMSDDALKMRGLSRDDFKKNDRIVSPF